MEYFVFVKVVISCNLLILVIVGKCQVKILLVKLYRRAYFSNAFLDIAFHWNTYKREHQFHSDNHDFPGKNQRKLTICMFDCMVPFGWFFNNYSELHTITSHSCRRQKNRFERFKQQGKVYENLWFKKISIILFGLPKKNILRL